MTSILTSHSSIQLTSVGKQKFRRRLSDVIIPGSVYPSISSGLSFPPRANHGYIRHYYGVQKNRHVCLSSVKDSDPQNPEDENPGDKSSSRSDNGGDSSENFRANLERSLGADDSSFSGIDLATLIRKKYGRSYDVQFIKKEFMGRSLLALNVMWKYAEQKSFPLTEEEYILRLDDVANTLRCWGAVSHIRNSLASSKERPRIGKAVSIFIDMDESGGRSNEWIYK